MRLKDLPIARRHLATDARISSDSAALSDDRSPSGPPEQQAVQRPSQGKWVRGSIRSIRRRHLVAHCYIRRIKHAFMRLWLTAHGATLRRASGSPVKGRRSGGFGTPLILKMGVPAEADTLSSVRSPMPKGSRRAWTSRWIDLLTVVALLSD